MTKQTKDGVYFYSFKFVNMGKLKDFYHDEINKMHSQMPDDIDWNSPGDPLDPPAEKIDLQTGKGMWTIKGYRIWASNYKEALELLPMIESM